MNKQEAIEKLNKEYNDFLSSPQPDGPFLEGYISASITAKSIIEQIDEPQKVVIPKIVAEWIEDNKSTIDTLYTAYALLSQRKNDVSLWVNSNQDTFARAWLDGYEAEKEKLYTVEIPDPNCVDGTTYLEKNVDGKIVLNGIFFYDCVKNNSWKRDDSVQLTESEIKEDFEWAWQWAEPVEEVCDKYDGF